MDLHTVVGILQESIFMILVFFGFFVYAMFRGRQSIINLILALYLALLISLKFPYYNYFLGSDDSATDAIVMLLMFGVFTLLALFLFHRLMPVGFEETAFQGLGKKLLFAALATILVMAFSYHALPVTDLITPGSPIQALFAPESRFFWWLILPLVGLFFV